jgi:outer membrane protein assembly factor BamB
VQKLRLSEQKANLFGFSSESNFNEVKMVPKMKQNVLISLLLILAFSACKNNTNIDENNPKDWAIFRGNSELTAFTNVNLPDNPILLWTFESGSNTKSSPIVYHQIAYFSDRRGRIFGVDINGKQVFDYAMNTATDAIPMIHNNVLYIGRIDGFLYAICLKKQDTLWTFETLGQIMASPNRMNFDGKDAIIVGSYDNYLYIINSENGSKISHFESGYYINGAVAVNNNTIVFGGCDGWIRIIDAVSGIQTDSLDVNDYIPASPVISENTVYIADHSGNVHELNLNNGKIESHKKIMKPMDENRKHTSVPAVSDKMIYIISDDRHVYAINRKNGSIAWKYLLKGETGESSPVIANHKLIICTRDGIVSILDTKNGKLLWEYDIGEQIFASPAVINGYFYVLTFRGNLFYFGAK